MADLHHEPSRSAPDVTFVTAMSLASGENTSFFADCVAKPSGHPTQHFSLPSFCIAMCNVRLLFATNPGKPFIFASREGEMESSNHEHQHTPNRFAVIPTAARLNANPDYTGKGVTVALLDSGFYPHPDLVKPTNRVIAFHDVLGERRDFIRSGCG